MRFQIEERVKVEKSINHMTCSISSSNLRVEIFTERLLLLESALLAVKSQIFSFHESIAELPVKIALQKILECIPPSALTTGRKNNEIINEEATKIDFIIGKYSCDGKNIGLPRQPKKYCTIKAYPKSESIKVVKVISKPIKFSDFTEGNVEHASNGQIQSHIQHSEKALQKSLQIIKALEKAAKGFEETLEPMESRHMPTLKEEVLCMVKHLRLNISLLLRGISKLNNYRQISRILIKLKQRATLREIIVKMEEERGKKKNWRI